MRYQTAMLAGLVALVSCDADVTPAEPVPARPDITVATLEPMIAPITYRHLIVEQCGVEGEDVRSEFLADLRVAGASAKVVGDVVAEMERIRVETGDNPDEYVCTPEMFEQSEASASAAMDAWAELKGQAQ